MKCFAIILIVLAFWPVLLNHSVNGRSVPLPTFVLPTKTYAVGSASHMGTAVLQVLPTLHMAHHNNGGQSGAWADSTISISTGFQVNPVYRVVLTGHASLDLANRHVQAAWCRVRHWWRVGSVWLVDAVVTFALYLLFSIAVGVTLLSRATVKRRAAVTQTKRKPTFVASTTLIETSPEHRICGLITQKPQSINTFILEGRLVLSSGPSASDGSVEWTVLFHPRQSYRPTGSATESRNLNTQLDVANKYLLNMLLHGVSSHHPWTSYLPGVLVIVPREVIGELHSPSKPTSATTISCVGATTQRTIHEPSFRRRLPPRKPTFIPSISRLGRLPKPAVQQSILVKRPRGPAPWIEEFTLEGRVLLYAGCTIPGRPVEWRIRFDPRRNFHLTRGGDDSSSHQREFADKRFLGILLYGDMAYRPSVVYVIDILLGIPGELVKRSSNVASHSLELTITTTTPPPSAIHTPDATTTIEYGAHPVDVLSASLQLASRSEPDAPVAVGLRDDRSSAERVDEPISVNTEDNAEDFGELLGYIDSHTPDSEEAEPVTPIPELPTSPNNTVLDATSDDLIREQKAAIIHELRLLFHVLEERACRGHTQTVWENASMEVREQDQVEEAPVENVQQDMADESPVNEDVQQDNVGEAPVEEDIQQDKADEAPAEEDVQQEEVHQRRKRRGGKRNTAWKNKRRQEKEDNERDPEAGSSGLR